MNALVKAPLDGEVLGPRDTVTVVAALHPLKSHHDVMEMPAGVSISEIIDAAAERFGMSRLAASAHVEIGGHAIARANWHRIRVKAGAHVMIRAVPGKGVGNIFKSILMIALTVFATAILGPAGLGLSAALGGGILGTAVTGLAVGAITFGGGLLLNALFPPAATKSDDSTPSYSISAGKNGVSKWGPIPFQLGKARVHPKYASPPYTEFDGDDQYLRMLFVWGYGPMKLTGLEIGSTAIDHYDDIEIQTFEGYPSDGQQTLYPSEVVQDDLSIDITKADGPYTQTAADDAVEISIDLVFGQGLVNVNTNNGKKTESTWTATIDLLVRNTETVVTSQTFSATAKSNDPIRRTVRFTGLTPGAALDVRVTKTSKDQGDDHADSCAWTAIRSIRTAPPIAFNKPLAITALRIRATKQLNGTIDDLSAIASTIAKSWNGSEWVDGQETRNPADLFRLVLQGPANAKPQPDVRLDLVTLEAFADRCRTKGYAFDMYRDFTASVADTLRDICAAGRAVPVFKDGLYSVSWEETGAPIVQHFTPRNARDFTWSQTYRDLPHGLRCKFVNNTKDYAEDEILVFRAGYDKTSATLYETAEFPGVTDPQNIVDMARYRIANAEQRPATYKLTTDFEHLIAQRGDRVVAAYDVIDTGIASGRVVAVAGNQITLDEPAVMEAGKIYGLRVRYADGSSNVCTVATAAGAHAVIAITDGTAPDVGDLYTFGIKGQETGTFRVLAIRPDASGDLSAEITLVDDAPEVEAGDGGDVPGSSGTAPEDLSKYRPRNLRAQQTVELRTAASIHVTRIYWDAVFGANYASFEAILTDDSGNTIKQTVAASERVAEFDALADGVYQAIVRALIVGGKFTPGSEPLEIEVNVPVGTVGVGSANIRPGSVFMQQLAQEVKDLQAFTGQQARDLQGQLLAIALQTADQDLSNYSDVQTIRTQLVSTRDDITAKYTQAIIAATGPGSALVAQITSLQAYVDDTVSTAIDTLSTQIDEVDGQTTANADAITALTTTVNGVTANATFRASSGYSPGSEYSARIGLEARVGTSDSYKEAGLYFDVSATQARVIIAAPSFVVYDPSSGATAAPLVYQNGELTLAVANIGTVTSGLLQSSNGKMVIDLDGGSISIFT